jgi:hypothetical protein
MRDDRDVGQPTGSRPSGGDGLRLASDATLFAVSWVFGISLVVSGAALVVTGGVVAFSWPRPAGERAGLPVPGP